MKKFNIKYTIAAMVLGFSIAGVAMPVNGHAYASTNAVTVSVPQYASPAAKKVIAAGLKYLGTPYQFGSSRSNTSTFDCSDFVHQAFWDGVHLRLPADSRSQAAYVKKVGKYTTNWHNLKPGDLMFFMSYKGLQKSSYPLNKSGQRITHVAIYLGNGKILHTFGAPGVTVSKFAGTHWEYRFIFGGSALK